eukprot:g18757.t1
MARQFCFEQVGGRYKLMEPGEIAPVIKPATPEQIRATQQRSAVKVQTKALKEERRKELEWKAVKEFLDLHQFRDVNDVKVSWFGLERSYPMTVAMQESNLTLGALAGWAPGVQHGQ